MLGLDDYVSSEDEGGESKQQQVKENGTTFSISTEEKAQAHSEPPQQEYTEQPTAPSLPPSNAPIQGLSLGPHPEPQPQPRPSPSGNSSTTPPNPSNTSNASPNANTNANANDIDTYTHHRTLTHNLTLPPIPNTSIPPSPPDSPNPTAEAKVKKFLKLKGEGVHFNARLAGSEGLRNPGLFGRLVGFAGIDEADQSDGLGDAGEDGGKAGVGMGQYTTTLPTPLQPVPSAGFPKWAYFEELNKSQAEITRKRERGRKDGGVIGFVGAKDGNIEKERGKDRGTGGSAGGSRDGSKGSSRTVSAGGTPGSATGGTADVARRVRGEQTKGRREGSRSPKRRRER